MLGAMIQISQRLARWPGVTLTAHRDGGLGIFVEDQELGQLHDCGLLDVSLSDVERDALLRECRVHHHHTFPDSGWVTLPINGLDDVPLAMEILNMAHVHVMKVACIPQAITCLSLADQAGLDVTDPVGLRDAQVLHRQFAWDATHRGERPGGLSARPVRRRNLRSTPLQ
ncbi:luciferase domain-containing protein [Deinococcus sp. UYEF24]